MTTAPTERPLAVVTGASSGIGLELAKVFSEHGFDLVVAAEDDGIERVAAGLPGAIAVRVDLATREGNAELVSRVPRTPTRCASTPGSVTPDASTRARSRTT